MGEAAEVKRALEKYHESSKAVTMIIIVRCAATCTLLRSHGSCDAEAYYWTRLRGTIAKTATGEEQQGVHCSTVGRPRGESVGPKITAQSAHAQRVSPASSINIPPGLPGSAHQSTLSPLSYPSIIPFARAPRIPLAQHVRRQHPKALEAYPTVL